MDEIDSEPSLEELNKAIDSLASVKSPGNDGIPPDLIKHCKTILLLPLHEVLCQCWQEGAVPQDTRDSKIITLYKNNDERNDCNNYCDSPSYTLSSYHPGFTFYSRLPLNSIKDYINSFVCCAIEFNLGKNVFSGIVLEHLRCSGRCRIHHS